MAHAGDPVSPGRRRRGSAGLSGLSSGGHAHGHRRTAQRVPRRSIIFIRETVGIRMPDGSLHDGIWYVSDVGPAIRGQRIDLFTGMGRSSMDPIMHLNTDHLSVVRMGTFEGCPPRD